jgi:hypothetical protein
MARKSRRTEFPRQVPSEYLRLALETREPSFNRRREITTALHAVSRELGWRVQEFFWNQIAKSYHWAHVQHEERQFAVLFEQGSRVTALAGRVAEYPNRGFFDDPDFCAAAATVGDGQFVVAPHQELTSELTEADRALIDAHPDVIWPDDMKYWKPRSVGEVLFNFWD